MSLSFKEIIHNTIETHAMFADGDQIFVALSGGADSVALLLVLVQESTCRNWTVRAIHINHHLRGAESSRDEEFCSTLCRKLGVPLSVVDVDVTAYCEMNKHLSIETAARELRYDAFERLPQGKIATAHTLSDSVETMLFNLVRGTGLDGIRGIPPVRGRIVRPLIEVTRGQVENFCQQCGQSFVIDSSNASPKFTRNRLRLDVVPVLKEINPSFEAAAGRLMRLAAGDINYLEQAADHLLRSATEPSGLVVRKIANLHPALRTRIIRRYLNTEGHNIDEQTILRADALLQSKRGSMQISREKILVNSRGVLKMESPANRIPGFLRNIEPDAFQKVIRVRLADGRWMTIRWLSLRDIKLFVNYIPLEFKNAIDCDRISRSLVLRGRRPKDSLRQWGRGCTKTLKKLINEAAVPLSARDRLAVLEDKGQLIWAEGFGVRDSAALTIHTERAVLIEMSGEELVPCTMTSNAF
jgi:tRNA(Ile)-lysidine synthase